MVWDLILQYWNDFLTIILFIVTVTIGYYQVKDYRAKPADIKISKITNANYKAITDGPYGADPYRFEEDDFKNTSYSIDLLVENDGREPATISKAELMLGDTGEKLELKMTEGIANEVSTISGESRVRLGANDEKQISYFIYGKPREEYPGEVQGTMRLNTTTGKVEEPVTFTLLVPTDEE